MHQLTKYANYNLWANTKVCNEFLSKLDETKLQQEIPSSFSSLRKTVYHIWDAEVIWLHRLTGGTQTALPIQHEPMTFLVFKERFLKNSKTLADFVSSKEEHYFSQTLSYKNSQGKEFTNTISDIIHHVMNHGTFHRGQIITMLRSIGVTELSSTDFITFCRLKV